MVLQVAFMSSVTRQTGGYMRKMHTALTAHQERDWSVHGAASRASLKTNAAKAAYGKPLAPVKGTGKFKKAK
jgi:hypothetical protein